MLRITRELAMSSAPVAILVVSVVTLLAFPGLKHAVSAVLAFLAGRGRVRVTELRRSTRMRARVREAHVTNT
jgi:hypothetical protein